MLAWGQRVSLLAAWVMGMVAGPTAAQEAESVAVPAAVSGSVTAAVPASVSGSVSASVAVPAAVPTSVPASAFVPTSVLVAPVQGSEALREELGERVLGAVRRALVARGYLEVASPELLGQAVVACRTPECVEQVLDATEAAFAIVPAIWSRERGGEELTLTLVQKSGRSLNGTGLVADELSETAADLLGQLLARQAAAPDDVEPLPPSGGSGSGALEPAHPHAWKAGPIILIAGGAAAFVAVGVAAGIRNDTQQLNAGAVAAWSAIGAAAIAGGIAWWVVGEKQRRRKAESTPAVAPTIAFRPTGIDLRLRF